MKALAGLSVVLVCANQEATVAEAIRSAIAAAADASDDYEVIVVDDASLDASLSVAAGLARREPRVRVLVHTGHCGWDAALRTGLGAASMPWILLSDAGTLLDARELATVAPLVAHADLLVGWWTPPASRFGGRARRLLARRVRRASATDTDCAFKLVRRDLAEDAALSVEGALLADELIHRATAAGARVCEVQVQPARDPLVKRRRPRRRVPPRSRLPAR